MAVSLKLNPCRTERNTETRRYSIRIATMGFTRPARTAGISMAARDTSTTPAVTSTTVTGSATPTSNSTVRM